MLEIDHLRVAFRIGGRLSVPVRDVSFSVPAGGRVALVGESGCGKSLTALALGGLVDRAEISGAIRGNPKIAYVFQNPMQSLDPVMRVGRQIAEAMEKKVKVRGEGEDTYKGSDPLYVGRSRDERIAQLLADVGLPKDAARKYPCELSGGQQQRVMIATALAAEPDLLIADEPTTALDTTTQQEILALIDRIADERHMAVLLITHNLGLVSEHSRTVNVMYAGTIVESGPVPQVLSSPRHPYTRGLIAAVPRIDSPQDAPLADIPGTVPPPTDWPSGCAFHPRCAFAEPACSAPSWRSCRFTNSNYNSNYNHENLH